MEKRPNRIRGRSEACKDDEEAEEMDKAGAKEFRGLAARANYLSLDRNDIQYAAKEVSKDMARPRRKSWKKMKRLS